jgi:hypothetical protein
MKAIALRDLRARCVRHSESSRLRTNPLRSSCWTRIEQPERGGDGESLAFAAARGIHQMVPLLSHCQGFALSWG